MIDLTVGYIAGFIALGHFIGESLKSASRRKKAKFYHSSAVESEHNCVHIGTYPQTRE